jgi:hypothetical protein
MPKKSIYKLDMHPSKASEKIGLTMVYSDIIVLALNKAIIDIGAKYEQKQDCC